MPLEAARFTRPFYRPELDVLRFIAFFLVFLRHGVPEAYGGRFAILAGIGGAGLQLFFLLSAFLITELLLQERERTGTIHVQAFFIRRALRIWPLYLGFIVITFAISRLFHNGFIPGSAVICFLLMAGNWWMSINGFNLDWIMHLWSISVEEQYYLLWPLLCKFGSNFAVYLVSVVMAVVAFGTIALLGAHGAVQHTVWCNSLVEFLYFACGSLIALSLHNRIYEPGTVLRLMLATGAFVSLYLAAAHCDLMNHGSVPTVRLLGGYGLIAIGVVLLFLAFYRANVHPSLSPLVFLGKISYGLYVFHLAALRAGIKAGRLLHLGTSVGLIIALLLSVAVASASFYGYERRFKGRFIGSRRHLKKTSTSH